MEISHLSSLNTFNACNLYKFKKDFLLELNQFFRGSKKYYFYYLIDYIQEK